VEPRILELMRPKVPEKKPTVPMPYSRVTACRWWCHIHWSTLTGSLGLWEHLFGGQDASLGGRPAEALVSMDYQPVGCACRLDLWPRCRRQLKSWSVGNE
jgi:hypothetical protein